MLMVSFNCSHKICISNHDCDWLLLVLHGQSLFSCRDVIAFTISALCEKGPGEFTGLIQSSHLQMCFDLVDGHVFLKDGSSYKKNIKNCSIKIKNHLEGGVCKSWSNQIWTWGLEAPKNDKGKTDLIIMGNRIVKRRASKNISQASGSSTYYGSLLTSWSKSVWSTYGHRKKIMLNGT